MKTISKIIVIAAVFLIGFYFGQRQATAPVVPDENAQDSALVQDEADRLISVNLKIDNGDDEPASFDNIAVAASSSVFDMLKKAAADHDIAFEYKDYGGDLGAMVESIGGRKNDFTANEYWQYWLNGEYAKVGAGTQILKEGDSVEWAYSSGVFDE